MRAAHSCLRNLATWILGVGAVLAQQAAPARPKTADNAAGLYQLAVAELARSLPQGAPRAGVQLLPGERDEDVVVGPGGDVEVGGEAVGMAAALAQTVLARDLFAQAAARQSCSFAAIPAAERASLEEGLARLAELVKADALANVDASPLVTCRSACALLSLAYHLHCANDGALEEMGGALDDELAALRLLEAGLSKLAGGARVRPDHDRLKAFLVAHQARRFNDWNVELAILRGVDVAVEMHSGRLRDMHLHVEGGFDQPAMVERLREILTGCMDPPRASGESLADWLAAVEQRLVKRLQQPRPDASVTEKATYGMAMMVLPNGRELSAANAAVMARFLRCEELLAGLRAADGGNR